MQEYSIEIKEVLSRITKVNAERLEEALKIVSDNYKSETIILDADDCIESMKIFTLRQILKTHQ